MNTKKYLLIILLISIIGNNGAVPVLNQIYDWSWSDLEYISTEMTTDSYNPSMVVDKDYNIHVTWYDTFDYGGSGADIDIFYKKFDYSTQLWSAPLVISTESTGNSFAPHMALDSENNIHVVWFDKTDFSFAGSDDDIFYKKFTSITQSWGITVLISAESTDSSKYAQIAVDSNDNLAVVWQDWTNYSNCGLDEDIFYKNFNYYTQEWELTEVVTTESTIASRIPSVAYDSEDNVHVVWHDYTDYANAGTDGDMFHKTRNVQSHEWSSMDLISTESTSASATNWQNSFVIDSEDNVHVVWYDGTNYTGVGTDLDIFYKKFNSSTQSWSLTQVITPKSLGDSRAHTVAIDSANTLHVVWEDVSDYNGAGPDRDIFYSFKPIDQASWSAPQVISKNSGWSRDPSIYIDGSQQVHLIWYDDTDYDNTGVDYDLFYQKLSGVPNTPLLENIVPNPNNGVIDLNWDDAFAANSYSVYRDVLPIYSVDGLTKIADTNDSHYIDELQVAGVYYYAISAHNIAGSSLSNTIYVEVNAQDTGDSTVVETITETEPSTETETSTENNNFTVTETVTTNNSITDSVPADFPVSLGLMTLTIGIIVIQRKRKN